MSKRHTKNRIGFIALFLLVFIIGFVITPFIPALSAWFKSNQALIFTSTALTLLPVTAIVIGIKKLRNPFDKVMCWLLLIASSCYLLWIYAITPFNTWAKEHTILSGIAIGLLVVMILLGMGIKILRNALNKSLSQNTETIPLPNGKRPPMPNETKIAVAKRANHQCQWWIASENRICGDTRYCEIHHIDKNHCNHSINNLIYLCPMHHKEAQNNTTRSLIVKEWAKGNY